MLWLQMLHTSKHEECLFDYHNFMRYIQSKLTAAATATTTTDTQSKNRRLLLCFMLLLLHFAQAQIESPNTHTVCGILTSERRVRATRKALPWPQ